MTQNLCLNAIPDALLKKKVLGKNLAKKSGRNPKKSGSNKTSQEQIQNISGRNPNKI